MILQFLGRLGIAILFMVLFVGTIITIADVVLAIQLVILEMKSRKG